MIKNALGTKYRYQMLVLVLKYFNVDPLMRPTKGELKFLLKTDSLTIAQILLAKIIAMNLYISHFYSLVIK